MDINHFRKKNRYFKICSLPGCAEHFSGLRNWLWKPSCGAGRQRSQSVSSEWKVKNYTLVYLVSELVAMLIPWCKLWETVTRLFGIWEEEVTSSWCLVMLTCFPGRLGGKGSFLAFHTWDWRMEFMWGRSILGSGMIPYRWGWACPEPCM